MMTRRNFFSSLLKGIGLFTILPPAQTYERIWKAFHPVVYPLADPTYCEFTQFLVDQVPRYDAAIMQDIRPVDGWIAVLERGEFVVEEIPFQPTPGHPFQVTLDRFKQRTSGLWLAQNACIAKNRMLQ
jgi:hypothetical protein